MRRQTSDPIFIDILIPRHAGRNDRLDRLIDWPKVAHTSTVSTPPAYAE